MAKDESIPFCRLRWCEKGFEACDFYGIEWELEHHLNGEVNVGLRAGEGVWVVGKDVRCPEDALDRAIFDIKLFVAKAFASVSATFINNMDFQEKPGRSDLGWQCLLLLRTEVPVCDCTVSKILP